jgi:hypothetical protein
VNFEGNYGKEKDRSERKSTLGFKTDFTTELLGDLDKSLGTWPFSSFSRR